MRTTLTIHLDGEECSAEIDARAVLVEALRMGFGKTGTRLGCATGDCGACTIWIDHTLSKSCMVLAVAAEGKRIDTVESARVDRHVRAAFLTHNAFQCGFCTSGMLAAASDLLAHDPSPNDAAIDLAMAGNLCRCACYQDIRTAIHAAADMIAREHTA